MRFLVDEDVDVRVLSVLHRLGHEARRVPAGTTNGAVIQLPRRERRVLITRDADFTNVNRYPPGRSPGVTRLAIHPPWLKKIVPPLTRLLTSVAPVGFQGKVFVLEETGSHVFP
jgi:hypothetical protein